MRFFSRRHCVNCSNRANATLSSRQKLSVTLRCLWLYRLEKLGCQRLVQRNTVADSVSVAAQWARHKEPRPEGGVSDLKRRL